ncbi:MAG TPA: O-antigen ligase family protein [Devosia sp.]|nr:O-antigen ligase family protein [Devosia sp.]
MALAATAGFAEPRPPRGRVFVAGALKILLDRLVWFWIFMGGMIIVEPSPYEFVFALVLPLALFAGMKVYRSTVGLLLLIVAFSPFAAIAAFQATYTPATSTLVYQGVTIFLMLTGFFLANYVAERPQERMRRIMQAYTAMAVISAIAGTLGYLHMVPGMYDVLTRYSRAKGFFQDPNVFAPFLILPAFYALQRLLLLRGRLSFLLNGAIFMVLMVGVFVSFSRAAWGSLAGGAAMLFLAVYFLEANAREKVRMLVLALMGSAMVVLALAGLLSIPSVGALFSERATVAESYDSGENGRFGRQGYAWDLALSNPLGIGPAEFHNLRITEEPHDTYVNVIHVYGWGGGLAFFAILALTLGKAVAGLWRAGPNRRLMLPLLATYVPLIIEAAIIDIDHWRHLYLLVGLIWGVSSGFERLMPGEDKKTAVV